MADNDQQDGEIIDDSAPLGAEHTPVLPDEEFLEKLADELDADERTALTGVNAGTNINHAPSENSAVFASSIETDLTDTVRTTGGSQVASDAESFAGLVSESAGETRNSLAADFVDGQGDPLADNGEGQDDLLANNGGDRDNDVDDNSGRQEARPASDDDDQDSDLDSEIADSGVSQGAAIGDGQSASVAAGEDTQDTDLDSQTGNSGGSQDDVLADSDADADQIAAQDTLLVDDFVSGQDDSFVDDESQEIGLDGLAGDNQSPQTAESSSAQEDAADDSDDDQDDDQNEILADSDDSQDDDQAEEPDDDGSQGNETAETGDSNSQSDLLANNGSAQSAAADGDSAERSSRAANEDDDSDDEQDDDSDSDGDSQGNQTTAASREHDDEASDNDGDDDGQDDLLADSDDDQDGDHVDEDEADDNDGDSQAADSSNGQNNSAAAADDNDSDDEQESQESGHQGPIIGTNQADDLDGTSDDNLIVAKLGDDTISGGAGDDRILAGKGDDIIEGGAGNDTMLGGLGDDQFVFTDSDFDGGGWTDVVNGHGDSGKQSSGYDTIDLTQVTDGWTLEIDGQGQEINGDGPSEYAAGEDFSGSITFEDGSSIVFENIEKVDW